MVEKAVIRLPSLCAGRAVVELDGVDVAASVSKLELAAEVGCPHRLTLTVLVMDVDVEAGGVQVIVPDKTREALLALGWTAPEGER